MRKGRCMHRVRAILVALAFALVAAPEVVPGASAALAARSLAQLRGIAELKSWFNAQKGHPRLILLLSPT